MPELASIHSQKVAPLSDLRLPRRELELGTIVAASTPSSSGDMVVSCPDVKFSTPLKTQNGTLVTAFTFKGEPHVVRFPEHGREISVLPAHNEDLGHDLRQRLFVSAIPSDLGHMLLTPFTGTGLPRLLAQTAVEHALATEGRAVARVRFKHIRDTLKQCGLAICHEEPISLMEKLQAQATERERKAKGMQFDYAAAKLLDAKVTMIRSVSRTEQETMQQCNLFSNIRVIDIVDGRLRQQLFPQS